MFYNDSESISTKLLIKNRYNRLHLCYKGGAVVAADSLPQKCFGDITVSTFTVFAGIYRHV